MNELGDPVCIVGVGARTPVGLSAPASAAAIRGSICAIGDHPYMVDKAGEPMSVAVAPLENSASRGVERFSALGGPAMQEALAPLIRSRATLAPPPVTIGLPSRRPGLPPELGQELAKCLQRAVPKAHSLGPITALPQGHAAGLMAMEEAWRGIQRGDTAFALVGGVDSYIDPDTLEWLDREEQLLSAQNRAGFPPGEGAGFCLMASASAAERCRLDILAWVVAVATTQEESRKDTDTVCTGKGLAEAILRVSTALKLPEEKINFTYCDMNGERYRSEEFAFAALRTQKAFVSTGDNWTPADCWGDIGAASGPLYAGLAVASALRGYAKGPRALLWAGSEGGQRCAALLLLPIQPGRGLT